MVIFTFYRTSWPKRFQAWHTCKVLFHISGIRRKVALNASELQSKQGPTIVSSDIWYNPHKYCWFDLMLTNLQNDLILTNVTKWSVWLRISVLSVYYNTIASLYTCSNNRNDYIISKIRLVSCNNKEELLLLCQSRKTLQLDVRYKNGTLLKLLSSLLTYFTINELIENFRVTCWSMAARALRSVFRWFSTHILQPEFIKINNIIQF
jgi:hypothetical protein